MTPEKRRIIAIAGAILVALIVAYSIELAIPKHDYFIEQRGELTGQQHGQEVLSGIVLESVHLVSSTGLEVDMRVMRPDVDDAEKLPLLLVLGGQETGKDGVDLVGRPDGIAYAAIDYPYHGHRSLHGFWKTVRAIPEIQRTFLNTPPAVSLALTWLLQQPWIDHERVELAGISLGVPFAAPAGALDKRFSRVWLMHGGADNALWVSHVARRHIENKFLRDLTARTTLFAVYGNSFEVERWIPEIAPRPLIIVAAKEDDFVPTESQAPFIQAAQSEFVELIWTEGRHVGPHREAELQQLLNIVRSRITGDDATSHMPGPIHPLEPLQPGRRGDRELVSLPPLDDSDAWFRLELVNLFGRKLDELLVSDQLIERVVAIVDNLPRRQVAERIRPVGRMASNFAVTASDDDTYVLSPENYERYDYLVDMLVFANTDQLVDAYRRYYPLLQQAYVGLGYPNGYFNDRVVELIDHLLATTIPDGPIGLVRPHVLYEYADAEVEALSSGQKLLIRMGSENAAHVKDALTQLRARISSD